MVGDGANDSAIRQRRLGRVTCDGPWAASKATEVVVRKESRLEARPADQDMATMAVWAEVRCACR